MKVEFYYDKLRVNGKMYCVQGQLKKDPLFFYSQKGLPILCFIISDVNNKSIECVSFGSEAEIFKKKIEINNIYEIKYVSTIDNNKYIKTNHKFKLLLTKDSDIVKLNIQRYSKGRKICVKPKKEPKHNGKRHQASIENWCKKIVKQ